MPKRQPTRIIDSDKTAMRGWLASPVMAFDRLPLRGKLFINAVIFIILLIGLAGFASFQIYTIQTQHIPARSAAREMQKTLLNMRLHERAMTLEIESSASTEFYIRHQSKSVDEWQRSLEQFQANAQTLRSIYKNTQIEAFLREADEHLATYRDSFSQLVSKYQERGFQAFGREGA